MSLPKINLPTTSVEIPSLKKKVQIRPMRVADEKLLLMAKEARSSYEIFNAVRQVVNNCLIEENFNIKSLATFDIDYLFLKLRAVSIGKDIDVTYLDYEDQKEYTVKIDLDKVEIKNQKDTSFDIKLDDAKILKLKYPSCMVYESPAFTSDEGGSAELFEELIVNCLDKFFDGDNIVNFSDYTIDQLKEFVQQLDLKTYGKIKEFIENLPSLYHETKYTNSKGTEQTIKSTSLTDFFTF